MMIPIELSDLQSALQQIEENISPFSPQKRYKIMLIAEEVLSNLARHATFDAKPDINLTIQESLLIFKDNAKPFNILALKSPDIHLPLKSRTVGGLGIYLIRRYAREIVYSYHNGYNVLKVYL